MSTEADPKTQPNADVLQAFKPFEQFCKCMLDAYAVLDKSGRVIKCNQLLSSLLGLATKQILRSSSLDDLLSLTMGGKDLKAGMFLGSNLPGRFDEVSGKAGEKNNLNLIIGTFPLMIDGNLVGVFVLIRDVTAETNLQGKYKDKATQSITDTLTGLYNRNYFGDYLKSQLEALSTLPDDSPQRIISVIMFDIDHFKKINDVYGHQAGDTVLGQTGLILKQCFRRTDMIARYGGEEFLAILPATDLEGALIAAEKVRVALAGHKFVSGDKTVPVTISSGVAQIGVGYESGEQAIARADEALYASKHQGRNRVSLHDGTKIIPAVEFGTAKKKLA
jgi:diguanylate cyclase (GGDEF)-like protein